MPKSTLAVSLASTLECLNSQGQGIRVAFQKQGDRFGQTIFGVRGEEAVPLLRSIEGTPDEIAPSSPPFAELHQQGETIFLSGATTLGHWSMSVHAIDGRLRFDVACRLKRRVEWLGSTYQIDALDYFLPCRDDTSWERERDSLAIFPAVREAKIYPTTVQWCYSIALKT